jgi:hypothetical protein
MTKQQFKSIGGGDVLLFRSGAVRTVLEGPVDLVKKRGPWTPSVTFTKLHNSHFRNPTTVYFWADMHYKIKAIIGKCKGVCLKSEVVRLKHLGFDPRKEFTARVQHEIHEAKRRGWKLCKRLRPLCR